MRTLAASLLAASLVAGCHLIWRYEAQPYYCVSKYDFNGTYRTRFATPPVDTSRRIWGDWLSMQLQHTPIELLDCQPMPKKTHPIKGTLSFFALYGAGFETFAFTGVVDLGEPNVARGTITKISGQSPEEIPVRLTLSIKQKDPSLKFTLCNSIPNVPPLPAVTGPTADWLELQVLGSPYVQKTANLEKCGR
jgi:hypothetical protein